MEGGALHSLQVSATSPSTSLVDLHHIINIIIINSINKNTRTMTTKQNKTGQITTLETSSPTHSSSNRSNTRRLYVNDYQKLFCCLSSHTHYQCVVVYAPSALNRAPNQGSFSRRSDWCLLDSQKMAAFCGDIWSTTLRITYTNTWRSPLLPL